MPSGATPLLSHRSGIAQVPHRVIGLTVPFERVCLVASVPGTRSRDGRGPGETTGQNVTVAITVPLLDVVDRAVADVAFEVLTSVTTPVAPFEHVVATDWALFELMLQLATTDTLTPKSPELVSALAEPDARSPATVTTKPTRLVRAVRRKLVRVMTTPAAAMMPVSNSPY